MKLILRLFSCCLVLGLMVLLTTCEQDALTDDALKPDLDAIDFRDEHINLCADQCQNNLFDFSDLEPDQVVNEYQGVILNTFVLEGTFPDVDLGDPGQLRVFNTDRTLEEALEEDCNGFNDDDLLFPGGPFGNVLVIQETPIKPNDCTNDRRDGGVIVADFSAFGSVTINCLEVFDTEDVQNVPGVGPASGGILLFDEDGIEIGEPIILPGLEDGEADAVEINTSGVAEMVVVLFGSGAISSICARADIPECPPEAEVLTFDELPENVPTTTVEGVDISAYPTPAIAFNTAAPTKCSDFDDPDMELPLPIDGLPPAFGFFNVLTNQHRSKTDCANADPRGGSIVFEFPTVSEVHSMAFVDTEEEGYVSFYGQSDVFLGTFPIPTTEDGGFDFLITNQQNVHKMVVDFGGSGGIDYVCFTPSDIPVEEVAYEGCTYDWKRWRKNKSESCLDLEGTTLCGMSYKDILNMKTKGRDQKILQKEVVTTALNFNCLSPSSTVILDALNSGFLLACEPFSKENIDVILRLKHFNNGLIGPGACD